MKVTVNVTVEPIDIYRKLPEKLRGFVDTVTNDLLESGCFYNRDQARDYVTIRIWKSIKEYAEA